jgi:hypothetical protein
MRIGFDVLAFGCAIALLFSAVGVRRPYHAAGRLATQQVMAEIGPHDVVLITRPTMYTFALEADTRVRLRATPDLVVGYMPRFADSRLHAIDWLTAAAKVEIRSEVQNADRVYVVDSAIDPKGYKPYRVGIADEIAAQGFEQTSATRVGTANVIVWHRKSATGSDAPG